MIFTPLEHSIFATNLRTHLFHSQSASTNTRANRRRRNHHDAIDRVIRNSHTTNSQRCEFTAYFASLSSVSNARTWIRRRRSVNRNRRRRKFWYLFAIKASKSGEFPDVHSVFLRFHTHTTDLNIDDDVESRIDEVESWFLQLVRDDSKIRRGRLTSDASLWMRSVLFCSQGAFSFSLLCFSFHADVQNRCSPYRVGFGPKAKTSYYSSHPKDQ